MERMNKAFVREPDEPDDLRCPSCNAIGQSVGSVTLTAQLSDDALRAISSNACFCPNPRCPVGYFDAFGQSVSADVVRRLNYPKDPAGPICACFDVAADDIIAAARRNDPTPVRELLERCQSPEAHCVTAAANGQSCAAELQRLYLRNRP